MRVHLVILLGFLTVGHVRLVKSFVTYSCGIQYATRIAWSCLEDSKGEYEKEKKEEKVEEKGDKHCKNKFKVMSCLRRKLMACRNVESILSEMNHSYDQCEGTELKPWLKHYLKRRYMPLTGECYALVSGRMFGSCKSSEKKYGDSSSEKWSFEGGKADQERMIIDGIHCLSPILARYSIEECGGRSGFDVYASALVNYINMPLFGMGLYHRLSMAASLADIPIHDY